MARILSFRELLPAAALLVSACGAREVTAAELCDEPEVFEGQTLTLELEPDTVFRSAAQIICDPSDPCCDSPVYLYGLRCGDEEGIQFVPRAIFDAGDWDASSEWVCDGAAACDATCPPLSRRRVTGVVTSETWISGGARPVLVIDFEELL